MVNTTKGAKKTSDRLSSSKRSGSQKSKEGSQDALKPPSWLGAASPWLYL